MLVSFFGEEERACSVHHYATITMITVKAEQVFNAVAEKFNADRIPLSNIISCLTDSASYMAGSKTGFLKRMMDGRLSSCT